MAINFIRETNYTFGMEDVYILGEEHSTLRRNHLEPTSYNYCVMATFDPIYAVNFYEYILCADGEAFCVYCKDTINTLILQTLQQ